MTDTTQTTDPLAAYLAEVRERVTLVLDPHVEPVPVPGDDAGNARLRLAFEDSPRLLAAIDRVLKRHVPINRGRVMHCCRGCEEENGEFHEDCCHEWPCGEYLAVSAALLGEDGSGGDRS